MILDAEETALLEESAAPVKFPRGLAIEVVRDLLPVIAPYCVKVLVAGSLRRKKANVGDIELLYVPCLRPGPRMDLLLPPADVSMVDPVLDALIARGVIEPRRNVIGSVSWGPKNKLALHKPSGVPVDFFAATVKNWWNYVVCRTGGARSNVAICQAARDRRWKWNPYGEGFSRRRVVFDPELERDVVQEEIHAVQSEAEVFDFVGLPYLEPEERL